MTMTVDWAFLMSAVAVPAAESICVEPVTVPPDWHAESPINPQDRIIVVNKTSRVRLKRRLIMDDHHTTVHLVRAVILEFASLLGNELEHLLVFGVS